MKHFGWNEPAEYGSVITMPMMVISFGTMSAVFAYSIQKRTFLYWRLILATAIMTTTYVLLTIGLSKNRYGHR